MSLRTLLAVAPPVRWPRGRMSVSSQVLPGVVAFIDGISILGTGFSLYLLLVGPIEDPSLYVAASSFVWLTTSMLLHFAGLYRLDAVMRPIGFADKIVVTFTTTVLFLLAAAFALKVSTDFSRLWIGSFAVGSCAATILFRLSASLVLRRLADMRVFTRHVVIVGAGEQAKKLLAHLDTSRPRFISVLGVFAETSVGPPTATDRYPLLGDFDSLISYARDHQVDDVIVALPW